MLPHRDRPGARAAAAVGGAEGFVRVVVHHVDAEIAGAGDAEDGVHVRAVEVEKRAGLVDQLGHLDDVRVELADGVGVGHHHRGDLVVQVGLEVVQIGQAIGADLIVTTPAPHMAQLAGLVPCAVSGARTMRRLGWPWSLK